MNNWTQVKNLNKGSSVREKKAFNSLITDFEFKKRSSLHNHNCYDNW